MRSGDCVGYFALVELPVRIPVFLSHLHHFVSCSKRVESCWDTRHICSLTCFLQSQDTPTLFPYSIPTLKTFFDLKMWPGVTTLILLSLIWEFGHARAQMDSVSQDELLASLLGDDASPPLSEEDGLTILGTGAVDPASTLSCHRRLYSYKVTKTDSTGKKCWDHVNVMSCWGRCDSNEIPDFRFPYKKSHHPVCMYGSRKPNFAILRNCDADVEPGTERYDYEEAETCNCSVCKTSVASCEGLRYRGVRSGFGTQK